MGKLPKTALTGTLFACDHQKEGASSLGPLCSWPPRRHNRCGPLSSLQADSQVDSSKEGKGAGKGVGTGSKADRGR